MKNLFLVSLFIFSSLSFAGDPYEDLAGCSNLFDNGVSETGKKCGGLLPGFQDQDFEIDLTVSEDPGFEGDREQEEDPEVIFASAREELREWRECIAQPSQGVECALPSSSALIQAAAAARERENLSDSDAMN